MSGKLPDSTPPKSGGLWARLFGVSSAPDSSKDTDPKDRLDDEATWASSQGAPMLPPSPSALPDNPFAAAAVEAEPVLAMPAAETDGETTLAGPARMTEQQLELPALDAPLTPPEPCPACGTLRKQAQPYCDDCGWLFSNQCSPQKTHAAFAAAPTTSTGAAFSADVATTATDVHSPVDTFTPVPSMRLKDRYEMVSPLGERAGVARFAGLDHSVKPPLAVVIVQSAAAEQQPAAIPQGEETFSGPVDDEFMPNFDDTLPANFALGAGTASSTEWPGVGWEEAVIAKLQNPGLPGIIERFTEGGNDYLVEESPEGQLLWDAWDDPSADASLRYGWLKQIAELLLLLHRSGVLCESLRPDIIKITPRGQAVLVDLGELLPMPVPAGTPIRASLYTAPELVLTPERADSRADLYSFGAMIYSLEYLHHGLEEKDFERQFSPKLITDRYPDVHPGLFRLISKTFVRDINSRLPTDEAIKEDRSGFVELTRMLEVCRKTFDSVRLDIAAWTTTGMIRSGNEDAFSFIHSVESRQDELSEYAMVLLCDGMGGYEAGELAAALALQAMRKYLLPQPIFSSLAGAEPPGPGVFSIDVAKKTLLAALKFANREVYTAARTPGKGKRGMGCTAECVYIDNRHVVVGHVGDSRTYHLHQGRLIQLTRDQTLVNRLVELGQLSAKEAEDHPRKNELQQAIGGQPEVEPGLYHGLLKRGDWVLVCSDGLTNHIPAEDLTMMLSREAMSAEDAARRLMNLVNLRGATDNATIVVVRAS